MRLVMINDASFSYHKLCQLMPQYIFSAYFYDNSNAAIG